MITRLGNGLVLGFLFTASFAWAGQPASAVSTDEGQQITIEVYDYAQAGLGILLKAEHVADGILKNAGVSIVWLACSADKTAPGNPGCADLSGPLKFAVHIEPNFMATKLRQTSDVFGLAAGTGEGEFPCDVWIFYDQVKELAVDKKLILSQILGSVIAHELGHLLLGANCHSRSGLMRAVWSREELLAANLGELHFSKSERTRIQDSVLARHQAQGLAQAQPAPDATSTRGNNAIPDPEAHSLAHLSTKLPFRLYWGYLVVVQGSIGNLQNLNFLVDTGSYPSVVDQKIAHNLALAEQPDRVNMATRSVQTRTVVLPSLLLGPVRVESFPVLTEDLSYFKKTFGEKLDAIVGMDVLRKSSFSINYRMKEVLFGPTESLSFSAPFETDTPLVTIQMKSQQLNLRLLIDTGGPDLMLFQSRMPESTGFQALGTDKAVDFSGTFQRRRVRIAEVYLGNARIGSQIAFVLDDRKDDKEYFDGVLGMRGPQFWKIAFDFEHRRFCWER